MNTINLLDEDECSNETFPCGDNAHCTDTDGSFDCNCVTGFQGDGFNCTGIYFNSRILGLIARQIPLHAII